MCVPCCLRADREKESRAETDNDSVVAAAEESHLHGRHGYMFVPLQDGSPPTDMTEYFTVEEKQPTCQERTKR